MPISVALVDDHRVVTRSLKAYLESFDDLKVVGIASSGEELLDHLSEWNPQVVLQDLLMPGIDVRVARAAVRRFGVGLGAYVVTIGLSFVSAPLTLVVHFALAIYYCFDHLGSDSAHDTEDVLEGR